MDFANRVFPVPKALRSGGSFYGLNRGCIYDIEKHLWCMNTVDFLTKATNTMGWLYLIRSCVLAIDENNV